MFRTPAFLLTLAVTFIALGLVPAQPAASTKYALLVGVNEYDHGDLRKLKFAEADATGLKEVLEKAGYKATMLTGKNATKAKVESALKDLVKKFKRGDTLLVGLAGHGLQFEGDKDSYYCPVDGRPFQNKADTLVSVKWVYERLYEDAAAGAKFLLVDACRNDPKSGRGRGIDADTTPNPPKGVGVLLSCSAGEISWEHESFGSGHGAFFHQVIEGFSGKAKDDQGNVTWDSLRAYVKREVVFEVPKIIKNGAKQTPEESGKLSGAPSVLVAKIVASNSGTVSDGDSVKEVAKEEKMEEFEYVIEGEKKKGSCRVLSLDIGGSEKMEFVWIKKGTFMMGSPNGEKDAGDSEKPQHKVEITKDYYLGKYTVTQGQYKAIMGENPSRFKGDRLPVETVSWDDAKVYCEKLSTKLKRKVVLPSEAQWEYACRAGTKTPFHFGTKLNGDLANCDGNYPYGTETKGRYEQKTAAAGSYPANPWGLYDMHGNVLQWCEDYYGPYQKLDSTRDPIQITKQSDNYRVLRGGSWHSHAWNCRSAHRIWRVSDNHLGNGFRVCLPLEK